MRQGLRKVLRLPRKQGAHLHLVLELARSRSAAREDGGPIAVRVGVDYLQRRVQAVRLRSPGTR